MFDFDAFEAELYAIMLSYDTQMTVIDKKLIAAILANLNKGKTVTVSVSSAMNSIGYRAGLAGIIVDAAFSAACVGYNISPKIVDGEALRKIMLADSWATDKVNLSDRLYGTSRNVRVEITNAINSAFRQGKTIVQMARDIYDGYGYGGKFSVADLPTYLENLKKYATALAKGNADILKQFETALKIAQDNIDKMLANNYAGTPNTDLVTAYKNILDAAKKLSVDGLENAAKVAVEERARYYADRIARTETAAAWFDGYMAQYEDDTDVFGFKWVLSTRHPKFDQCDVAANANVGFGRGVYPKSKVPRIPRHPHCMCALELVYEWEVDKDTKFNPDGAREYIDELTKAQKMDLFGEDGTGLYENGGNWEKLLRGWDGFQGPRKRLGKDDFE